MIDTLTAVAGRLQLSLPSALQEAFPSGRSVPIGNWDLDLIVCFGQAGAKKVYAVEASVMAEYARKLVMDNPGT